MVAKNKLPWRSRFQILGGTGFGTSLSPFFLSHHHLFSRFRQVMAEPYHLQKTASGDVEKGSLEAHTQVVHDTIDLDGNRPLQRQMKPRHIQMISIGGVIGTGLFLGKSFRTSNERYERVLMAAYRYRERAPQRWSRWSLARLHDHGLHLLLRHASTWRDGRFVFFHFSSPPDRPTNSPPILHHAAAHIPIAGGHITLANRFVSPSLSFTMVRVENRASSSGSHETRLLSCRCEPGLELHVQLDHRLAR